MTTLRALRYGAVPYGQALALQHALRDQLADGAPHPGWLIALEHTPVVTLGKRGKESDLISPAQLDANGVELFRVERGGEATFHGPGQLVVYAVTRLSDLNLGIVDLVRGIATGVADAVAQFGVESVYDPKHPGLWTTETPARKIASVGMRVSRDISTHGVALNVVNNLIPFSWIVACGMPNVPMTRLADYHDQPLDFAHVREVALAAIARALNVELLDTELPLPTEDAWVRTLPLPASTP